MSTGLEGIVTQTWITSTLEGDGSVSAAAPGGVYDGPAEEGATYPLIRIGLQSAVEVRGNSTVTIMHNSLWLVRGITASKTYVDLEDVESGIYRLLHGVLQQAVSGGMIVSSVREQPFRLESVQGGREYRHLGGLYRIFTQTT